MTKTNPLMLCGHVAVARDENGGPVCPICFGIDPRATMLDTRDLDLTGRTARCAYGDSEKPSSVSLPFFEYLGPGSREAAETCGNCGYYVTAHTETHKCTEFRPRGDRGYDRYYCGCRGWD